MNNKKQWHEIESFIRSCFLFRLPSSLFFFFKENISYTLQIQNQQYTTTNHKTKVVERNLTSLEYIYLYIYSFISSRLEWKSAS